MSAGPGDSTAPSGPPDGAHPSVTSGEGHTVTSSQGGRFRLMSDMDLPTGAGRSQTEKMSRSLGSVRPPSGATASTAQMLQIPSQTGQKQGQGMESVQTGSARSSEQHRYKRYPIPADLAQLLQVLDVSDKLKAKLMDKECMINCKSASEGFINIFGSGHEEDVTTTLKELFHWESIDVGEDDQDVEKALKSFKEKHAGKVSYVPEEGRWSICVTADIKDDIHSEIEKLKQAHCLVHLPLCVSELVAFKMDRVNSLIKADVDGSVTVSVPDDGEKLGIELSSKRKYMKQAVEWLHNFVLKLKTGSAGSSEQHRYKRYPIPADLAQLLQVLDVSDKLKAKLMDKECMINCKSASEGFINIARNGREEDLTTTLKELFHWESIDVGEDDQDVEKALKSFKEKHAGKVRYVPEEGRWSICVTADIKDDIHSEIEKLKQAHCLVHLPLYVSELVAFQMDRVNSLIKADVDGSVTVSVPDDGEKLGVELLCERKYKKRAVEWLHNFVLELETTEKALEVEEARFFQDLEGQKMIQEVEGEFFCRIDTVVDEDWSGLCATAPSGQRLLVCQDTMAATDCDCIVLPLWEGQTEWTPLQRWILRRSFLSESIASYHEVCHKDPISLQGNADFLGKTIVIVPIPAVWGEGAKKEKEWITTSYKKAFALCGEHQRSVAVCAKQSPKFPTRRSTKPLLVAVKETFSTQDPPSTACQTVVIYADSVQDRMMTCQDVVNFLPPGWHLKPPRVPRSKPGKGIIKVCIGELQKIEADVIVNSTDMSLMSSEGAVQLAIGLAAGQEMFDACQKLYPHGISVNGLAVTDSFCMKNAKKIYHIALSRDTFAEHKRNILLHDLRQVILHCLVKASLEEHTSIAFPTLGSGQLKYPCDDVARVMFSTIGSFFREMPHTTLQKVIIVVYQGNLAAIQSLKMEEISQLYTFSSDEEQAAQTPALRLTLELHRIQIIHGNVFQKPWVSDVCLHGKLASERGESSQTGDCQSIIVDNARATKEGYKKYLKAAFRKGRTVQIAADTLCCESLEDLASALESVLSSDKSGGCLVSVVFSGWEKAYMFGNFFQKVQSGHLECDQGKGHQGQMFVSSWKGGEEIARKVNGFKVSTRHKKLMKSYQKTCEDQIRKQNEERRHDQEHDQVKIILPTALLEDVDLSQIMNCTHTRGEKMTDTCIYVKFKDLVSTKTKLSEIIGMKSKEKEPGRSEKISSPEEETTEEWSIVKDDLEVEALKFLLREEFDQAFDMNENQDGFLLTFKGASSKALENQVASLMREDVQLNPEEVAQLGDTVDVRSEGVEAFVKPVPYMDKAAVFAFDSNAMTKAKHLVTVKSGRVKVTARSRRRFDAGASGPQDQTSSKPGDFSPPMSDAQPKVFTTPSGIKVTVYKANIIKLSIDAIVNAANENLAHEGGVAAVISRAAGFALEEEGREHIRKHGPLQVTEVVDTTAGLLACRKVLHAVGPRWESYADKAQCQQHLVDTVFNCLQKAGSLGFTSVALPSISAAIFGVPQHICAQSYLLAVKKFDSFQGHTTSVREIHFVDINDAMISTIQSTFSAHWNAPTSSSPGDQAIQTAAGGRNRQDQSSPVPNMTEENQEKPQDMPHVPVPNMSEESQEKPLVMLPRTETSQGVETVVFPRMTEVWADKEQQVQIAFKDRNLTLILRNQPITDTASESVILWQDSQNIMRDAIWKQLKKRMSPQAIGLADNFKKSMTTTDKIYDFNRTNKQFVFIVVSSSAAYDEEKIGAFLEQALNKVDLANKKTVAITGKPKEGKAKTLNKDIEDSEIFTHALYKAVKSYARRSTRSITEVHVMEPDSNTLLLMAEKLRTLVAIDQTLLEESKSQPPPQSTNPTSRSAHSIDPCRICQDRPTDPKALRCGHVFCTPCIDQWFQTKPTCPTCNPIQGIVLGDQPEDGKMRMRYKIYNSCPGFPPGKYTVEYTFSGGYQKANHPNPGKWYFGTSRTAYLPDTPEGRKVLMLLKVAFDRRLVFTIGKSATTGDIGIVWNNIHHKTSTQGGPESHGYPDPTYLTRVQGELAAKGVTGKDLNDIQLDFIASPAKVQSEYPAGRDFSEYFRTWETGV